MIELATFFKTRQSLDEQHPVLPLDLYVLQQSVLPLDAFVLQQSVLLLDVSVLQQSVLPLDVFFLQQTVLPLNVYSTAACMCVPGGDWPTAACAAPGRVCLQEPVLQLYMSVYKSLWCSFACLYS
jgi:hypothetical protein